MSFYAIYPMMRILGPRSLEVMNRYAPVSLQLRLLCSASDASRGSGRAGMDDAGVPPYAGDSQLDTGFEDEEGWWLPAAGKTISSKTVQRLQRLPEPG